jgi:hypothetical protein
MPRPHDGHELQYRMDGITTSQPAEIKPDGWVKVLEPTFEIERIDGDVYMVCMTCGVMRLRSGEDGLADDWEAE